MRFATEISKCPAYKAKELINEINEKKGNGKVNTLLFCCCSRVMRHKK